MLTSLFISYLRPCLVGMAALLATALFAGQAPSATITYLINFGDSSYTTDGSNTWNSPTQTFFETLTTSGNEFTVVDTSGNNPLDLAVTFIGATQSGWLAYTANTGGTWPSLSWFNGAVAQQRAYLNGWQNAEERWLLSGLDPTDTINVQWIANHHQTNNVRTVTYEIEGVTSNVISGNAVSSLNFATQLASNDDKWMEWNVVPDVNGELEFHIDGGAGATAFGAWGNAMRIEVTTEEAPAAVPEPSALALAATGLVAIGLLIGRRL